MFPFDMITAGACAAERGREPFPWATARQGKSPPPPPRAGHPSHRLGPGQSCKWTRNRRRKRRRDPSTDHSDYVWCGAPFLAFSHPVPFFTLSTRAMSLALRTGAGRRESDGRAPGSDMTRRGRYGREKQTAPVVGSSSGECSDLRGQASISLVHPPSRMRTAHVARRRGLTIPSAEHEHNLVTALPS